MEEARKWKRKYQRMHRLAVRVIAELRKFSPRCAENAERTLAAVAGSGKGGESE